MKILLLNPATRSGEKVLKSDRCQVKVLVGLGLWPPISLAECAAVLRDAGHEVSILDSIILQQSFDQMVDAVARERPDVLVFQNTTPTLPDDIEAATRVKQHLPEVAIVYYGLHATTRPQDFLSETIPFAIRNEPEHTLLEVVDHVSQPAAKPVGEILSLTYWKDGKVHANPDRPLVEDLDDLPFAAREYLPNHLYILPIRGVPFTIIKTSRGCPYSCTYCTAIPFSRKKWRVRSPQSITEEVVECRRRFGIHHFMFLSDTFNMREDLTLELCERLCRDAPGVTWVSNSRVDTLTEKMAHLMKAAGCYAVSLGIESGDNDILRRIKKMATTDDARRAVAILRKAGIKSIGYFMFGLPGESRDTMRKTIEFAKEIDPNYAYFFAATPFPGTELYEEARVNGWLLTKDWSHYFHGVSDVIHYGNLTPGEIQAAVTEAYKRFYFRPHKVAQEILNIQRFSDLTRFFSLSMDFLRTTVFRPRANPVAPPLTSSNGGRVTIYSARADNDQTTR